MGIWGECTIFCGLMCVNYSLVVYVMNAIAFCCAHVHTACTFIKVTSFLANKAEHERVQQQPTKPINWKVSVLVESNPNQLFLRKVSVNVKIDINRSGILYVTATETSTGIHQSRKMKREGYYYKENEKDETKTKYNSILLDLGI